PLGFDSQVAGIALDSQANVYVADGDHQRIVKFDSQGNYVLSWGTKGTTGNGSFSLPSGIAIDSSDNVYVVDAGNGVTDWLQVFDPSGSGKPLRQWNGSGGVSGQFAAPQGVAVDSSANVYVADTLNQRIQIFASDSTFESRYGSSGTGDGQFTEPY